MLYPRENFYKKYKDSQIFASLQEDLQLIENDDMDQKSQCKVMAAGFRIIRADDYPQPRIKFKDAKTENWKTLAKFETKATRDRSMEQLLEDDLTITD